MKTHGFPLRRPAIHGYSTSSHPPGVKEANFGDKLRELLTGINGDTLVAVDQTYLGFTVPGVDGRMEGMDTPLKINMEPIVGGAP